MTTKTLTVSFKTDSKGFMSRECPACERSFKVNHGKAPKPLSHCPFCDHHGTNCWLTPEQAKYMESVAMSAVVGPAMDKLDRSLRNLGRSGGNLKITGSLTKPPVLTQPAEREDDTLVETTLACCGETVRHEATNVVVHCMLCGKPPAQP